MTKHFIDLDDHSFEDLQGIIDNAIALKKSHKSGEINESLKNKTLAMIFDKSSTRTRVSFEAGMTQLGGHSLFLSDKDIQIGRGEPLTDSAIVIGSMVDATMLRVSCHDDIVTFAKHAGTPVINALSDQSHPCQMLADLMTYQEHRGSIKDKKVVWVGDGNNVCASLIHAAPKFGYSLAIGTPARFAPDDEDIEIARDLQGRIDLYETAEEAVAGADVVIADTFVSMGDADAERRLEILEPYAVTEELMEMAAGGAKFLHCLPAHRGEEVDAEVIDGPQSLVFDEAENRMHAQKAILRWCLDK